MVNNIYTIDAHCHIYPEKIAQKAIAGTDNFYSTKSWGEGTVSHLIKSGTKAGIDHFIVQSVATTPKQVSSINRFIATKAENSGGILTGLGTLHPDSADIKGDVTEILKLGLKGVKLHPDIQGFKLDDYRCLKIYELCEENGLPMLIHTGDKRYDYSNPNRMLPILDTYKNLTVIGAHLGGWSIWESAVDYYREYPNFYVDCSSSFYYLKPETAKSIIRKYTAEKVLFGTDYPMWQQSKEIEYFLSLSLDETEISSILNMNAKKIFGLE